jgi:hypothetical protein
MPSSLAAATAAARNARQSLLRQAWREQHQQPQREFQPASPSPLLARAQLRMVEPTINFKARALRVCLFFILIYVLVASVVFFKQDAGISSVDIRRAAEVPQQQPQPPHSQARARTRHERGHAPRSYLGSRHKAVADAVLRRHLDDGGDGKHNAWAGPVDAVWTHVDPSDSAWRRAFANLTGRADVSPDDNRFRSWSELRYSMRSVAMHAPWVRRVIVVVASARQIPEWLDASHPRVRIVLHAEIFDHADAQLPTFNSLAIESVLHRIPGLSEHFLYFNNDVFLARPTPLAAFATPATYQRCTDWPLLLPPPPPPLPPAQHSANARTSADPCRAAVDADSQPAPTLVRECSVPGAVRAEHVLDRWAARHHFGVELDHWFCHKPHLLRRQSLLHVERVLAVPLGDTRASRFRDAGRDVSLFLMYESFLRSRAAPSQLTWQFIDTSTIEKRRLVPRGTAPEYLYRTFTDRPGDGTSDFYRKLDCVLLQAPRFFAIDDDLGRAPSPQLLAFHRAHLGALMRRHWATPAPWEVREHVEAARRLVESASERAVVAGFACDPEAARLGMF